MAGKQDNRGKYPTAAHLFDLVDALRAGQRLTVASVMNRFEVDRATADRYLKFLLARYEWVEKKWSGSRLVWRSVGGRRTEQALFDAVALGFGARSLACLRGTRYHRDLLRLLDQTRQNLPEDSHEVVDRFSRCFHYRTEGAADYTSMAADIDQLLEAIRDRRRCSITYERVSDGTVGEYQIEPWFLVYYRDRLYLLARKIPDGVRRTFDLEGLQSLTVDEEGAPFAPPLEHDADPSFVFEHSFGIWTDLGTPTDVEILVRGPAARTLLRRRLHPSQAHDPEREDGWVPVRFRVAVCPELRSYLLSLLPDVRVLQPDSLREELAVAAQAALAGQD